jgi:riboflavin synthase
VNLEPALPADGHFDGHIVQGHVDGTATISGLRSDPDPRIEFAADASLLQLMVPKGSVAIDGVSLTIASMEKDRFSVAVIPTTMAETTLSQLAEGQKVNIEMDVLGKYVRRYLQNILSDAAEGSPGGLTIEKLRESGFI